MEASLVYKTFSRDKTIDELLYNTSWWRFEYHFIDRELAFIKHLIKAYPFKETIPNLYERLQLFILELDNFNKEKNNIIIEIDNYETNLNANKKLKEMGNGSFHLLEYEKLAEKVFNYMKHYRDFKIRVYEYINGLMN